MIALWILVWLAGWVALYVLQVRMSETHPKNWDSDKRSSVIVISCFSWIGIAVCVVGLCFVLILWYGIISPWIEYVDPKIKKAEAYIRDFKFKKTKK
jgi:hypothetical protein